MEGLSLPTCLKPQEFTNWALTSQALLWIQQFIQVQDIRTIVECGSGLSTILFAAQKLDRVLSLEHDFNWYTYTRHRLQEKGLLKYVDLQLCNLRQLALNRTLVKWYDIDAIASFPTDLILVDGPPGNSSLLARYPAPHLLKAFVKDGTWILLDDYYRLAETQIVALWLKEIPQLQLVKVVNLQYGLAVLRYHQAP